MTTEQTKTVNNQDQIKVTLPDGRILIAKNKQDDEYPGISIDICDKDGSEQSILWVEYNTARIDYESQQRLRIIAWNKKDDEPAVNMSYDTGEFETDKH